MRRPRSCPSIVLVALFVAVVLGWLWPPELACAGDLPRLPSALEGPGVPELGRRQARHLERSVHELEHGNLAAAVKRATKAGAVSPAHLVLAQCKLLEGADDAQSELEALCEWNPEYAAAWLTLSVAAEAAGDEQTALEAARHAAGLWPGDSRDARVTELENRWVVGRLARARELLTAGDHEGALTEVASATNLDSNAPGARLLVGEILFDAGRFDEADAVLAELPDIPDALFLRGRIAEQRGDWQTAMDSYAALPPDHPDRALALDHAQTRWRLSVLPTYAREAMSSEALDRGELAVLLVAVEPRLETLPGSHVPVMSDIVDHPGQREIVTVVRLGIMEADLRDHRFHPDAPVNADTVRETVNRTAALLHADPPQWCSDEDVVRSTCIILSSPPSGGEVVSAVLGIAPGADR